jgi:hypothetical protein
MLYITLAARRSEMGDWDLAQLFGCRLVVVAVGEYDPTEDTRGAQRKIEKESSDRRKWSRRDHTHALSVLRRTGFRRPNRPANRNGVRGWSYLQIMWPWDARRSRQTANDSDGFSYMWRRSAEVFETNLPPDARMKKTQCGSAGLS